MFNEKREFSQKGRNRLYLVLDCETATLPFADAITKSAEEKQKIAIGKPLIYDIAWTVIDSSMNIYCRRSFLVTEIFSVPSVFNTAYYKDKRPLYTERLRKNEIALQDWNSIIDILQNDLRQVDYCCAFNAMFDFKKAIPYTEKYIAQIYSDKYQEWEVREKDHCIKMLTEKFQKKETDFNPNIFTLRSNEYLIIDIWGVACEKLLNNPTFKKNCIKENMITESGKFFKTSAESAYRFLIKDYQFEEMHAAIDDTEIESYILAKALKKGKIPLGIVYFPFKKLGTVQEFLEQNKKGD